MAKSWAETLAIPYLKRPVGFLGNASQRGNLVGLLVATRKGPQVETERGSFITIPVWQRFACGPLKKEKRTIWWKPWPFGLAAGSLTGPWALPRTQRLFLMLWDRRNSRGVEASPILYQMTRLGLRSYDEGDEDLLKALRRIEPVLGDTAAYLESLPPDSFDAVYFDPMFEHPVEGSSNMVPMRPAADHRPLTRSVIEKGTQGGPSCRRQGTKPTVLDRIGRPGNPRRPL